jgi:hypothetical protein
MAREISRPGDTEDFVASFVGRVACRMRGTLRLIAIAGLGVTLAACGGGGGSSSDGGGSGGGGVVPVGTGNVTVTVTDDADTALAGANVSVTGGTVTKTGTTAADGTVTLSDIPAGSASISATKDLYGAASKSVTITKDVTAASTVKMTRKTGSITGTVTDQFNTPISGATVAATIEGKSFSGRTASDGTVTLSKIPTGPVAVSVTANGFKTPAGQNVTVTENTASPFSIKLERLTQAVGGLVSSVSVASSVGLSAPSAGAPSIAPTTARRTMRRNPTMTAPTARERRVGVQSRGMGRVARV